METGKYIFFSAISLLTFACTEEQDFGIRQGEGSPIFLSASVDNNGQTGSRANSVDVQEGQYYLTFTNTQNNQQIVSTFFTNSIGYPYVYNSSGTGIPLEWTSIKNTNGQSTLTLDNVQNSSQVEIQLGEAYKAAEDTGNNENDIVWGKVSATWNTPKPVNFTLTHQMASVKVNISVLDGLNDVEKEVEKGVSVSFLNIRTTPSTFNRSTGNVSVDYTSKKVERVEIHNGPLINAEDTKTWIFPPLQFNDGRPKLQIRLNNGTTYTGTIPETMISGEGNTENSDATSETLAFVAGRLLTIRVLLVNNVKDQPILFLPARVERWNPKGPVSIECDQVGINNTAEYAIVVNAYNSTLKNETTLKRYATFNDGKWTIRIFADLGEGSLPDNLKFINDGMLNLILNGHKVYGETDAEKLMREPTTGGEPEDTNNNKEEEL